MDNRYSNTMLKDAILTKVDVALVDVTPNMAREWLECNIKTNRTLKTKVVEKYANDMKAGKFGINPDAITFNAEGELVNGQHRLSAVIKAKTNVMMFVAFGFPITAQELLNVDRGAQRTIADNLELSGMTDEVYTRNVSTASMFLRSKMKTHNPSAEQIFEHIKKHYKAYADVNSITKMGKRGGSGGMKVAVAAAILAAYLSGENFDALAKFCQVFRTHDTTGCDGYNTKFAENLREELSKTKAANAPQVYLSECYINAFARNAGRVVKRNDYYPASRLDS